MPKEPEKRKNLQGRSPRSKNTNLSPDHWHNINTSRDSFSQLTLVSILKLCNCTSNAPSSQEGLDALTDLTSHISHRWKRSNWTTLEFALFVRTLALLFFTSSSAGGRVLGSLGSESLIAATMKVWLPQDSSARITIAYNPWWSGRPMSYRICATVREDSIVLRATLASSDSYPRNSL